MATKPCYDTNLGIRDYVGILPGSHKTTNSLRTILEADVADEHEVGRISPKSYSRSLCSLKALVITETELKVIAALATIGLRSTPKKG